MGLAMPNMDPQVQAAPAKPAIAESAPAAPPAAVRPNGNGNGSGTPAPVGNGAAPQQAGNGKGEDDWWTE
jgi:hypothetical protein